MQINDQAAIFNGHLDIETLGGAGFASQRTTGDDRHWDLSHYDGINLVLDPSDSDGKQYTFILKDELLPRNPDNGREQATISWEYDFRISDTSDPTVSNSVDVSIFIPWDRLMPTYRGKKKDSGHGLVVIKDIRRMSIMMRRYVFADLYVGVLLTNRTASLARSMAISPFP